MTPLTLHIGADEDVTYEGARRADTGAYLNAGTCTFALKTAAGVAVGGGTGTLTYVTGSDGDYRGTLPASVTTALTPNARYWLEITFTQSGFDDFRRLPCWAKYRDGV